MSLGRCSVAVPVRRGQVVVAALGIVVPSLKRDRRDSCQHSRSRLAASDARLNRVSIGDPAP